MTDLREKLIAATIDLDSGPAHTVDDFLQAIRDAGYALVPVEPTEAILCVSPRMTPTLYKAMLEAAQEPRR